MIPVETSLQTEVAESWKPHRRTDQQLRMGGGVAYRGRSSSIALIERTKTFTVLFSVSEFVEQIFKQAGPYYRLTELNNDTSNFTAIFRALCNFANRSLPSTIVVLSARIYDVCGDGRSILFSRRRRSSSLAFHDLPSSFHLVENKKDRERAR